MTVMPAFLDEIIGHLRRRGLQIGVDDCLELRRALVAGFGTDSDTALRRLCLALWATSTAEAEIIDATFARVDVPKWQAWTKAEAPAGDPATPGAGSAGPVGTAEETQPEPELKSVGPAETSIRGLSGLVHQPPRTGRRDVSLVLTPQYPVTEREVIQVWRMLRRPTRQGPPVELDIDGTLARRASSGLPTPPVMVAARRNTTRLLLIVDRQGSMAPFHDYVDHVRSAMERAGRFDTFTVVYLHNTAGRSDSHAVLSMLPDPFSPVLDPVLSGIRPLTDGQVYQDPDLTRPLRLDAVLAAVTRTSSVVVISDAGAARGALNTPRVLDTVALAKAIRAATEGSVWLNPAAPDRWARSTAGQLARHLPMFPLTRVGMYRAVNVLRGRPIPLERPL